jgi:hypothetical protein
LRDNIFEVSLADCAVTERQLIKLLNDCILPLAMQTHALIIISAGNDCSLAVAAERVLGPVQTRLGVDCPFTVLGFGYVTEFHRKSVQDPESLAAQMCEASPTWSTRQEIAHEVYQAEYGAELQNAECLDLNSACSCYVIFEGIDIETKKESWGAPINFDNSFMEAMIKTVPTVCVVTQYPDFDLHEFSDLLARNVPVLFLDARERWPLLKRDGSYKPMTELAKLSNSMDDPASEEWEEALRRERSISNGKIRRESQAKKHDKCTNLASAAQGVWKLIAERT